MNQRSMAVLKMLVEQEGYLSNTQLSKAFRISRRSIYNDIGRINDWLKERGLDSVKQVRTEGFYLDESTKQTLKQTYILVQDHYYEYTKEERRAWTFLHIACSSKPYFLEDLQNLFQVSRNTVLEDIKAIKKEIEFDQLKMYADRKKGYHILGREMDVRKTITQYLSIVTPTDNWYSLLDQPHVNEADLPQTYLIFDVKALHQIHHLLAEYEKQFNIEIIDDVLNSLVLWFHCFIKRMEQGATVQVDPVEKEIIETTEIYLGVKRLCQQLFVNITNAVDKKEESYYFAKYLLSAKVNYDLTPYKENSVMQSLIGVVEKMVTDFQLYAAVEFDEPEQIMENLLLHLKPAYYRIKYGIKLENTLRDSVKQTYPEVFHITKLVMKHFEALIEQTVDDNEIAFIATHFGGWLRREGVILEEKPKKLLIVCTNGLGTSKLLESQLLALFSNVKIHGVTSLREYQHMDLVVDFIVSTIPLPDRGVPVFVVSPVLNNDEKEQLLKNVNSMFGVGTRKEYSVDSLLDIVQRYASIKDEEALRKEIRRFLYTPAQAISSSKKENLQQLLPINRVQLQESVSTWQQAITLAAQPLLDEGYIKRGYIDKMLEAIYENGPYIVISDQFALPHAGSSEDVYQTGLSMLCLQQPVDLLGKDVSIIVVLASEDNEQHLKALAQLTKLFSEKNNKQLVMEADNISIIYELITKYSQSILA
ncbi:MULTISPECIES: BglG family transcription antiterminator [Clostridia]|uniref:BglG family transcription antiterminator n=1 Tax=Clostridia TaxID=186801 RepID=UPI000EA160D3|nr:MULTISPECIES: BglG family transcription antiterminator [Clostridia]NBJ68216.1 PRD domain-containing protein [Roseburia sp. 1XD42-34]RKI81987.1 PRD domain-containing protein [Clostridium sp. 1xD42-85]